LPIIASMKKPPKKGRLDFAQLAKAVVDAATDETEPDAESAKTRAGRVGGRRGGNARAAALSKQQRSEIAKKAANARWAKGKKPIP
jgi:hypothetical protein